MYSDIFETLTTLSDVTLLRQELETLQAALFKIKNGGLEGALQHAVRASTAAMLQNIFRKQKPEDVLRDVLQQLNTLDTLALTLAFEPSQAFLETLHAWVKKELGNTVVMDLKCAPNIYGGAQIAYKGKYADYSLKKAIELAVDQISPEVVHAHA